MESERIGKHMMNNYDFMRHEIDSWKDEMINKGWGKILTDGFTFTDQYWIDQAKLREKPKPDDTYRGWTFMTISPDKKSVGSIGHDELDKLTDWCKKWFQEYNYGEYYWALEHGSNEQPHYHVHALVKDVKKRLKRDGHYKTLMNQWKLSKPLTTCASWAQKQKSKKSYDILWQTINDEKLWWQKYNYLCDELKGTHRNFKDLKIGEGLPG